MASPEGPNGGVSGARAPRLLAREQRDLDALAEPIREGRRVSAFLVCPAALRPAVIGYLAERTGRLLGEPVAVADAERMLTVLSEAAEAGSGEVRSLALDVSAEGAVQALNWHREKLRRGASVWIWLEDVEALRVVRRVAPDAYSFRDVVVAVEGEERVAVVGADVEHEDVRLGRARYNSARTPFEKALAALPLAAYLRSRGSTRQAVELLDDGLWALPLLGIRTEEEAELAASLRMEKGASLYCEGREAESWQVIQSARATLAPFRGQLARRARLMVAAWLPSPLGEPHRELRHAIKKARSEKLLDETARTMLWFYSARSECTRGEMRRAAMLLREIGSRENVYDRAMVAMGRGELALRSGRFDEARAYSLEASEIWLSGDHGNRASVLLLARCVALQGDVLIARKMLAQVANQTDQRADQDVWRACRMLGELTVDCGSTTEGLSELDNLLQNLADSRRDGPMYQVASTLAECTISVHEAGRLLPQSVLMAESVLDAAEGVAVSISGDDPPWYHALYPTLRGRLLALLPERTTEAIDMTQAALSLCERSWSDAVPMIARTLATHFSATGRFQECLSLIERVTPQLVEERFLEELARIQAIRLNCLARTGSPQADIEQAMTALRDTFQEMGAPRITADTLLELALLLPPEAAPPDPLPLLEEAHELFADMPIVAKEARCLEAIGDLLAARGKPDEARGYHRSAREILERHGLKLRVPLLDKKLGDRPSPTTAAAS